MNKYILVFLLTNLILKIVTGPQADIYSFILALFCDTKTSLIIKVICSAYSYSPDALVAQSLETPLENSIYWQYLAFFLANAPG